MAKKVLVIDDEKSITTIIEKIASNLGYQVQTLNDPALAAVEIEAFQPDILLLDMIMPDLDGIDIMRALLTAGTRTRIILMTGFGHGYMRLGQAVAEFHQHPSVATLAKPFRRIDLAAILEAEDCDELPAAEDLPVFPVAFDLNPPGQLAAA